MPLNSSSLGSRLEGIFSNQLPSLVMGPQVAQACNDYFMGGKTPGLGSVVTSGGLSVCSSLMSSAFSGFYLTSAIPAKLVADAINIMLSGAILSGGKYGTGPIIGMNVSQLASDFQRIFSSYLTTEAQVGKEMANSIHNYTLSGTCIGTGISPDYIPQIGPLT